jgi:hypothetical protein
VISRRVILDAPFQLALFVSQLLAGQRRDIGTRDGTRALTCRRQAGVALAWFRNGRTSADWGVGFGIL